MGLKHRWSYESIVDRMKHTEVPECRSAATRQVNVALIFPGPYTIGMSNLGFLTVHRLLSAIPNIGVERFFFPIREGFRHAPPFYSFENGRPLGDFDVLAFSFSFEGDFDRLPVLLGPLGIPIQAEKRKRVHPLLIAGGAAVGSNPAALSAIFDILVPGEAETTVEAIFQQLLASRLDPQSCADLPGVWVPRIKNAPNASPPPFDVSRQPAYSHIVTSENVFGGSPLIEVMRGCPRTCAFCLARRLYFPPRPVSLETFMEWVNQRPNMKELGLVAPSLFDYPFFVPMLKFLAGRGVAIRNSSVKWEKLSDEVLELLSRCGPRSLTLAPETGSPRLGLAMGKALRAQEFCDTIRRILDFGFENLKLYFIAGLPGETLEDLDQTVELIDNVRQVVEARGKSLTTAFSGFVPKRGTPWQDQAGPEPSELKKRFAYLKTAIHHLSGSIKTLFESPSHIARQAYLCSAGPQLAEEYEIEAQEWKKRGSFSLKSDSVWDF